MDDYNKKIIEGSVEITDLLKVTNDIIIIDKTTGNEVNLGKLLEEILIRLKY